MRSSPWVTVSRLCIRPVSCWVAFPSAPALGSTGSAPDRSGTFVGFTATMAGSDFSSPFIIGYGSSPSRCGPPKRPDMRSPGSRTRSVRTCQGLRPRRVARALALSRRCVLPSAETTASAPGFLVLSRLNGWPVRSPADASTLPSRSCRTARGQCGMLRLHCGGLSPPTPCRSPGAPSRTMATSAGACGHPSRRDPAGRPQDEDPRSLAPPDEALYISPRFKRPSSSGPGHRPFTAVTRVRVP
jgi:hypothetical protein